MIRYAVRDLVRYVSWSIMVKTAKRAHVDGWHRRAYSLSSRAYCWAVPVKEPHLG